MNYYQKYDLWHWIFLIIAWLLISFLYFYLVFVGPLAYIKEGLIKDYVQGYWIFLEIGIFAVFFGSIHFMINYLSRYWHFLRRGSIGKIIFFKTVFYIIGLISVALLNYQIFYWLEIVPFRQIDTLISEVNVSFIISNTLFFVVCILLFNFLGQVSQKFGVGVLERMLLGQYRKPHSEERIFMFLDLKSSTSIAEKLGHERYGRLIQRLFGEVTNIVRRHEAEIYQYAGDEIVLTWNKKRGIKDFNCLQLFFAFKQQLERRQLYYQKHFGVLPKFKAGLDIGIVTRVEVGEIKRDIGYYGNVLNTASRIQNKCNELGYPLLISEYLKDVFNSNNLFHFEYLGDDTLKGKSEATGIYAPILKQEYLAKHNSQTA